MAPSTPHTARSTGNPSAVAAITNPPARATTLKFVPHAGTPDPPQE
jgi:hypothetical protein